MSASAFAKSAANRVKSTRMQPLEDAIRVGVS